MTDPTTNRLIGRQVEHEHDGIIGTVTAIKSTTIVVDGPTGRHWLPLSDENTRWRVVKTTEDSHLPDGPLEVEDQPVTADDVDRLRRAGAPDWMVDQARGLVTDPTINELPPLGTKVRTDNGFTAVVAGYDPWQPGKVQLHNLNRDGVPNVDLGWWEPSRFTVTAAAEPIPVNVKHPDNQ